MCAVSVKTLNLVCIENITGLSILERKLSRNLQCSLEVTYHENLWCICCDATFIRFSQFRALMTAMPSLRIHHLLRHIAILGLHIRGYKAEKRCRFQVPYYLMYIESTIAPWTSILGSKGGERCMQSSLCPTWLRGELRSIGETVRWPISANQQTEVWCLRVCSHNIFRCVFFTCSFCAFLACLIHTENALFVKTHQRFLALLQGVNLASHNVNVLAWGVKTPQERTCCFFERRVFYILLKKGVFAGVIGA